MPTGHCSVTASIARCSRPPTHDRRRLRNGTAIPYVSHLPAASLALEMGVSETEAIGALLHDAAN
jgi:hypothetical protein